MQCWVDSVPHQRGYMARMQTLWCEMHPEFSHYTQKYLRNQAAYLALHGYELLVVQREPAGEGADGNNQVLIAPSPAQTPQQASQQREEIRRSDDIRRSEDIERSEDERLEDERSEDERSEDIRRSEDIERSESERPEDMSTRRKINSKVPPKPQQLASENAKLANSLPEDVDLLSLNWAVYEHAAKLVPRTRSGESLRIMKMRRRCTQLQEKIDLARKQASRIQCVISFIQSGRAFTPKVRRISADLRYHYHTLNKMNLLVIKERFVGKVRALGIIKQSLEKRMKRSTENSTFRIDPRRWFQPATPVSGEAPTADRVENFWRGWYSHEPEFHEDTPALQRFVAFCSEHQRQGDECQPITVKEVREVLKGTKNHSAPGPDGLTIFWWKKFTSTHQHLARVFSSFLNGSTPIPQWLVEGRTVLIPKKGDLSDPGNYRPITCLNALYKIFTKILYERVLVQVEPIWRLIHEQRGAKRGLSGCKENLLVDRSLVQDAIQYKRNLSVAWIDYRKAFDSTSHQLLLYLLECLGVNEDLVRCMRDLVSLWRTRFTITSGETKVTTGVVQYRRGIFQGDSLSPLLFCISLLPLSVALRSVRGYEAGPPGHRVHKISHLYYMDDLKLFASGMRELNLLIEVVATYSRAVGMSFGLDKCAVFHLRRGRLGDGERDIQLVDGGAIHHLGAEEAYRYLGFDQQSLINVETVKETLCSEYKRRLQKIWKSELSGRNKVAATNMFAVPVLLYSFGIVKWRRDELKQLDIVTRKVMHLHRSLHPRSSTPRLYMPREEGGRGLLGLECLHDRLVLGLASDVWESVDPLLVFVHNHELQGVGAHLYKAANRAAESLGLEFCLHSGDISVNSIVRESKFRRKQIIRAAEQNALFQQHLDRPMHGMFFRHVQEQGLSVQLTFNFFKSAGLMSETEGFICACQDGVINTLVYRSRIMGLEVPDTACRACKRAPETLTHILSACPVRAVSGYIHRHNAALRVLYYFLRHSYAIDKTPVLPYVPGEIESVVVNERCKIYWNFSFPTIRPIGATKPDVVLYDFGDKTIYVIEFSAPAEHNVERKEEEKRQKYQDLLFQLRQMNRGFRVKLVILIIGSLGGMKQSFVSELSIIPACKSRAYQLAGQMQKAVILGSLRLLRQFESGLQ